MKFRYRLTFQDLLHLDRLLAQRRAGMSLFLLHFCGLTLGPLGVVVTAFCLLNWRSVFSPMSLGAAFPLLIWPLCL